MSTEEAAAPPQERELRRSQFTLRTLLSVMTLAAISLGLVRASVALGTVFVLASVPALARTLRAVRRRGAGSRPVGPPLVIGTFLESLLTVLLLAVAWLCTGLVACLTAGLLAALIALSACRRVATCLARISQGFGRLRAPALLATGRCVAVSGCLLRRYCTP